ncbi:hypothetical protein G9A89_020769 [Geosiphon pyriformis]|nr:hypothetical protein G9A89_020769 [Geosiphon pyriformis]
MKNLNFCNRFLRQQYSRFYWRDNPKGYSNHNLFKASKFIYYRSLSTQSKPPEESLKGWRKYAARFRSKPASYIFSFALLHEITAIIPIPIVYIFLDRTGVNIPFPEKMMDDGNRFINKVVNYYGWKGFENGSRVAINAATSYAIVKILLPVRIAACVWLTPWLAERIIGPLMLAFRRLASSNIVKS